jgi:hypothetical protein
MDYSRNHTSFMTSHYSPFFPYSCYQCLYVSDTQWGFQELKWGRKRNWDWGCSSVIEWLPSMSKALVSNTHTHFILPGIVEQACNSSTWEAEVGRSQIWGHPGLHSKFQATLSLSLDYSMRSGLKK